MLLDYSEMFTDPQTRDEELAAHAAKPAAEQDAIELAWLKAEFEAGRTHGQTLVCQLGKKADG